MLAVVLGLAAVAIASAQSCTPSYGGYSTSDELTAPETFEVTMTLLGGSSPIVIEVNRTWSPSGADHFYTLLRDKYFDCSIFYTISSGENGYLQGGIAADPEQTAKWSDFISENKASNVARQSNIKYNVAYVPLDGYGTRSTHFMIHLDDNSYLDSNFYHPFGRVLSGFDTLTEVSASSFTLSEDGMSSFKSGGNDWLFTTYSEDDLALMTSLTTDFSSSSSGSKEDSAGSWAFGIIIVLIASAACVYAGVYIYRYIRTQQGYDSMSSDSMSGSSEQVVLNSNL